MFIDCGIENHHSPRLGVGLVPMESVSGTGKHPNMNVETQIPLELGVGEFVRERYRKFCAPSVH